MSAGPRGRFTRWFVAHNEEILLLVVGLTIVVLLVLAGLPYYGEVLGASEVAGVPVGAAAVRSVAHISVGLAVGALAVLGLYLAIR